MWTCDRCNGQHLLTAKRGAIQTNMTWDQVVEHHRWKLIKKDHGSFHICAECVAEEP